MVFRFCWMDDIKCGEIKIFEWKDERVVAPGPSNNIEQMCAHQWLQYIYFFQFSGRHWFFFYIGVFICSQRPLYRLLFPSVCGMYGFLRYCVISFIDAIYMRENAIPLEYPIHLEQDNLDDNLHFARLFRCFALQF